MKRNFDMINGNLWSQVLLFTLPLALTGVLQQMFNAADVAVVGKCVGKEAMAAVGATSPIVGLIVGFFAGISLGTNVMIATFTGQKNKEDIKKAVHTSIVFSLIIGFVIGFAAEFLSVEILKAIKVPSDVFALSERYLRIYFLGMPLIMLYNFEAAIFRSIGDTNTPLLVLVISGILNVLGNVFFVVVLKMSVSGVALATVLSNAVSALILMAFLMFRENDVQVQLKELKIDFRLLGSILRIGVPSGIQGMVFSFANVIIQSAINSLGSHVMAASAAAFNLEVFAFLFVNAFGSACTTFVGQNNGAGKIKRCLKTLKVAYVEDVAFTATSCIVILSLGKILLRIFTDDPEIIEIGYIRLIWIFSTYIFSLTVEVFSGYLRGFAISLLPALITTIGVCGVRISWIYTIFRREPSFTRIMQCYPASMAVTALILVTCTLIIRPSRKFAS